MCSRVEGVGGHRALDESGVSHQWRRRCKVDQTGQPGAQAPPQCGVRAGWRGTDGHQDADRQKVEKTHSLFVCIVQFYFFTALLGYNCYTCVWTKSDRRTKTPTEEARKTE